MSVAAITWAFQQKIKPASVKFVLVTMADCANDLGLSFPSVPYLAEKTCQDRKTILAAIAHLLEQRYMIDTGERRGRTGQVKVYRLLCVSKRTESGTVQHYDAPHRQSNEAFTEGQNTNSTENGTVPISTKNSPVFPSKESRFSQQRVPKTGHGSVREPSEDPKDRNQETNGLLTQPAQATPSVDPPGFDQFPSIYPARDGSQRWADARKAFRARLREGTPLAKILEGARLYAAKVRAERFEGTSRVLQAATFVGTNRCFEESWKPEIQQRASRVDERQRPQEFPS